MRRVHPEVSQPGDQVAIVSDRGVITATVTGTEMVQPEGGSQAYYSTVVDQPVVPGWSGSPMVLTTPDDPDQGKVVATTAIYILGRNRIRTTSEGFSSLSGQG